MVEEARGDPRYRDRQLTESGGLIYLAVGFSADARARWRRPRATRPPPRPRPPGAGEGRDGLRRDAGRASSSRRGPSASTRNEPPPGATSPRRVASSRSPAYPGGFDSRRRRQPERSPGRGGPRAAGRGGRDPAPTSSSTPPDEFVARIEGQSPLYLYSWFVGQDAGTGAPERLPHEGRSPAASARSTGPATRAPPWTAPSPTFRPRPEPEDRLAQAPRALGPPRRRAPLDSALLRARGPDPPRRDSTCPAAPTGSSSSPRPAWPAAGADLPPAPSRRPTSSSPGPAGRVGSRRRLLLHRLRAPPRRRARAAGRCPAITDAGSFSTSMSGSTPWPSMIHCRRRRWSPAAARRPCPPSISGPRPEMPTTPPQVRLPISGPSPALRNMREDVAVGGRGLVDQADHVAVEDGAGVGRRLVARRRRSGCRAASASSRSMIHCETLPPPLERTSTTSPSLRICG